jgi:hypothetical protein
MKNLASKDINKEDLAEMNTNINYSTNVLGTKKTNHNYPKKASLYIKQGDGVLSGQKGPLLNICLT